MTELCESDMIYMLGYVPVEAWAYAIRDKIITEASGIEMMRAAGFDHVDIDDVKYLVEEQKRKAVKEA